jgi:predicted metal-binding protein
MSNELMTELYGLIDKACAATGIPVQDCAVIKTGDLVFSQELLNICKTNKCGNYNKSWTCPPACGTLEAQKEQILAYGNALVFTTMHDLEDSFDLENMNLGRSLHTILTLNIRKSLGFALTFGAGACPVCMTEDGKISCKFPAACDFPEKRIGSIEAAGINVSELSKTAGIAYNNGEKTVTFFSMILLEGME